MSRVLAGISTAIGAIGSGLGASLLGDVVTRAASSGADLLKIEVFQDIIKTWFAEYLQIFLAQPDPQSVIDPSGIVNIFIEALKSVAKMGMIMRQEVVDELFLELLQEGFSNAIQFSVAGALQNIYGFYRGAVPLQPTETAKIFRDVDNIHPNLAKYLTAVSGEAVATLSYRMLEGYKQYLDEEYGAIREQLIAHSRLLNDVVMWYNNVYRAELERMMARGIRMLEELYDRYVSLMYNIVDRALGRLNEVMADGDSSYVLWQNNIITDQEAYDDLSEVELFLDSTKNIFDETYNMLKTQLQNDIQTYVFPAVKTIIDQRMRELYFILSQITSSVVVDYNFQKAVDIIETIQKIRQTTLVSITAEEQIVETPPPPPPPQIVVITITGVFASDYAVSAAYALPETKRKVEVVSVKRASAIYISFAKEPVLGVDIL